jgi:RecA/RadA recombinase
VTLARQGQAPISPRKFLKKGDLNPNLNSDQKGLEPEGNIGGPGEYNRANKKQSVMAKTTKEFSFLELDKELSKIAGFETGSILADNTFSDVDDWIPTGNYLLNAQLSGTLFGGIPNTRSLGLMGDPGTGKSFVCLNVTREAQKKGYNVIYCDTEGAIDRSTATKFGIDPHQIRYQPIKTVTEFQTFVSNLLDLVKKAKLNGAQPKILLILDSLGMLSTDKELRDAIEGKNAADMGAKAKELRKLFRVITLDLTQAKIPLVCTNHVYAGGGYLPTKESSGGDGPIFAMSVISFLSKAQLKEGNSTTKTGIIVTSNLKKSRFTIPEPVKFHISFLNGMNPYVGLQEFVSWEACGIARGKLEETKGPDGTKSLTFVPSESPQSRWAVKHLGKTVPSTQLFTPEVFTEEVLKQLDVNVIQKHFQLPTVPLHDEISASLENDLFSNE